MLTRIIQRCIPVSIKKKKLMALFCLSADAFRCEMPDLKKLSFQDCLREYALFTREQAARCLQKEENLEEIKQRLYENAFFFGRDLRKGYPLLHRRKPAEVMKLCYQLIGIDFQYNGRGEFTIKHCFFSSYYTAEVCTLISSLDEGLAAGLTGRKLSFSQRITEGYPCCKGVFK